VLSPLTARKGGRRSFAHAAHLLQLRSLLPIIEEMEGGRARKKRSRPPANVLRRR
jgi:hypothetical protein